MKRTAASLIVLLVVGWASVGCVQEVVLPDDCNATAVQRDASLTGARLDPEAIGLCKGQDVTIKVTSPRAGNLHLHGYDIEKSVEAGNTATFQFTASRAGQFVIEFHDEEAGTETEVGLITVHEP